MITIALKTGEELQEEANRLPVDADGYSVEVYSGFSYLSPLDFTFQGSEYNTQFFCAYEVDELIGAMKVKRYSIRTHKTVLEKDAERVKNYVAIRYIDVREDKRRKGAATHLLQAFNEWIGEGQKIALSPLSDLGRKANLREKIEKVVKKATLIRV